MVGLGGGVVFVAAWASVGRGAGGMGSVFIETLLVGLGGGGTVCTEELAAGGGGVEVPGGRYRTTSGLAGGLGGPLSP